LIPRAARIAVTAAVVLMTAAVYVPAASSQSGADSLHLLDVPYLPQSEALCGGAAIAMVMRFFGVTNVYAETFSSLVDRTAGGIRGEDLLSALRARGWQAQSFRGDAAKKNTNKKNYKGNRTKGEEKIEETKKNTKVSIQTKNWTKVINKKTHKKEET